jgi:4-nitrophenyl phosphatase
MDPTRPLVPRLVILDLDGVVYRGKQPVDGAASLIAALHERGVMVRFATNNSMATRAAYVDRLGGMGITAAIDEIVTSTSATIDHLREHLPEVRRVLAVGAPGMLEELRDAGLTAAAAADAVGSDYDGGPLPDAYDAVIAGLDPAFDYRRLAAALSALRAGALFIATNADLRYPTPSGFLPGAGSIIASLQAASGIEPLVIGKPQPGVFEAILERAGIEPRDAVTIGDNPDADVVAAHRAGIASILVLTGVTDEATARALSGERRPDLVARDPTEVAALLGLTLR